MLQELNKTHYVTQRLSFCIADSALMGEGGGLDDLLGPFQLHESLIIMEPM